MDVDNRAYLARSYMSSAISRRQKMTGKDWPTIEDSGRTYKEDREREMVFIKILRVLQS